VKLIFAAMPWQRRLYVGALIAIGLNCLGAVSAWAVLAAETPSSAGFPADADTRIIVAQNERRTIGYIENVVIEPGNLQVKAKIDTGAKSSSIDAINILPFQRDGKQWVRFIVVVDGDKRRYFEIPVVRTVGVRRAGAPVHRRYVVEMGICLGGIYKKTDVNLVNRKGMNYRMLIGRIFMKESFLVNPDATFLTSPSCKVPRRG
jgi:hypothetical protein